MKPLKNLDKDTWQIKSLVDLSSDFFTVDSISNESRSKNLCPFIRSRDLTSLNSYFLNNYKDFINLNSTNKFTFCSYGDLLMIGVTMSKYLIGKTYLYLGKGDCLTGPGIYLIKHKENPFYLIFAFQSFFTQRKLYWMYKKHASPSKAVKIFFKDLKKLQFSIPPKHIQDLIGKFLYSLSLVIEKLENTFNEVRERKLEQYTHYSKELLINRNKGKLTFLNEIALDIYYGKEIFKSQLNTGNYPAIKAGDVNSKIGSTFFSCFSFVDKNLIKEKVYFNNGDILFASIWTKKEDIKGIAYLGNDNPLLGKGVICLKHKENPKFLAYFLSTKYFKKQVNSLIFPTTIVNFYPSHIKQIKISLPSLEEQEKIVEKLDVFYNSIERLKVIIPELIQLNKLRLQYYINNLTTI